MFPNERGTPPPGVKRVCIQKLVAYSTCYVRPLYLRSAAFTKCHIMAEKISQYEQSSVGVLQKYSHSSGKLAVDVGVGICIRAVVIDIFIAAINASVVAIHVHNDVYVDIDIVVIRDIRIKDLIDGRNGQIPYSAGPIGNVFIDVFWLEVGQLGHNNP